MRPARAIIAAVLAAIGAGAAQAARTNSPECRALQTDLLGLERARDRLGSAWVAENRGMVGARFAEIRREAERLGCVLQSRTPVVPSPEAADAGGLGRLDLWWPSIVKAARVHGLDPVLFAALAVAESNLDPLALSPKGARGLTQLMPETIELLGIRDAFDPEENLAGGARYLSLMLERFGNDLRRALAAYNAGPERIGSGRPWPDETRGYVARVLRLRNELRPRLSGR